MLAVLFAFVEVADSVDLPEHNKSVPHLTTIHECFFFFFPCRFSLSGGLGFIIIMLSRKHEFIAKKFFTTTRKYSAEFKMLATTRRFLTKKNINWFQRPLVCRDYGIDIIQDPLWNKALAFDLSERDRLGIRGLLPPVVRTLEDQASRVMKHIRNQPNDVAKNMYLQDLHGRNETLYHRILMDNIEELAPLVYTPTVGLVCQQFGNKFRRPRGMYFSSQDRGMMSTMAYNWPISDVHVIVVTDGSRILGLGDLGAQGMGIPIGKLALYCAAGGIAPHRVLPITLDVGTNNQQLLDDPNYIGMRHRRLEGDEYYDMVDEFVQAVTFRWPDVCVQFEDFETPRALPLLKKYRNQFRCFNDDIQGTGAVSVASLLGAAKVAGTKLKDIRVVCAGGGSAGQGVSSSIKDALVRNGLSEEEAASRICIVTVDGCIGAPSGANGNPHYKNGSTTDFKDGMLEPWRNNAVADGTSLLDTIKQHKPNLLLGLTTVGGLFTEEIVRTMGEFSDRPIIMPLSNPTAKAECTAEQAYKWTDGRAVVATGSPFPEYQHKGKTLIPSQCNNMYIFPGLGLAASITGVKIFTDEMFYLASQACAESLTECEMAEGRTFPRVSRIREVSKAIAVAVSKHAHEQNLTTKVKKSNVREGWEHFISRKMYYPEYVPLFSKPKAE